MPEVSEETCHLLGWFGVFVQLILFMFSVGALLAKKLMPTERRPWRIFLLDISKQLITTGFIHTLNIALSVYLVTLTDYNNGCVWYFINFCMDNLLGIVICYCIFKVIDHFAVANQIEVLKQGVYYEEAADLADS